MAAKFSLLLSFAVLCYGAEEINKKVRVPLNPDRFLDVTGNLFKVDHLSGDLEYKSKLDMSINPGCLINNCTLLNGNEVSVINVTVHDTPQQDDEQHWLWSVIGRPTVQAAITKPNDISKIDWSSIFDMTKEHFGKCIGYEKQPLYSGAVMLMNLIEFDDINDQANIDLSSSKPVIYPIINFRWTRTVIENTEDRLAIEFIGTNYTSTLNETILSGKINLTISAYAIEGYGRWLPHLSHSSKTSQVDIQLVGLETSSGFNNSRFAVELVMTSSSPKFYNVTKQVSTTLDDEHTPGIFKTYELILPGQNESDTDYQSYLQWRPVVYTTTERDLSESTGVKVSETVEIDRVNSSSIIARSLLYALYGEDLNENLVRKMNVTFGSPEDGFYKKTKYHAWTFTFGVGEPIRNSLSPVLILATIAMLGILIVVFVVASIICIVRKWKKRSEENFDSNYSRLSS